MVTNVTAHHEPCQFLILVDRRKGRSEREERFLLVKAMYMMYIHVYTSTGSTTSLTTQRMSKRERIGSVRSTYAQTNTFSISIIILMLALQSENRLQRAHVLLFLVP